MQNEKRRMHFVVSFMLLAALGLTRPSIVDAQSGWPSAKPAPKAVAAPKRLASFVGAGLETRPSTARKKKVVPRKAVAVMAASDRDALLRSMAELLNRQASVIEALASRLESAERRLASLTMPASGPVASDATFDPARTGLGLAIDWSQVIVATLK